MWCFDLFHRLQKRYIRNEPSDINGCISILDVAIDDKSFILINLYNPNTEAEQLKTLSKLTDINQVTSYSKVTILDREFNLLYNVKLDSYEGNPVFKKCSTGKILELKKTYDLTGIWRIRNPKTKQYTFWRKHIPEFLQKCLDYFFISKNIWYDMIHLFNFCIKTVVHIVVKYD